MNERISQDMLKRIASKDLEAFEDFKASEELKGIFDKLDSQTINEIANDQALALFNAAHIRESEIESISADNEYETTERPIVIGGRFVTIDDIVVAFYSCVLNPKAFAVWMFLNEYNSFCDSGTINYIDSITKAAVFAVVSKYGIEALYEYFGNLQQVYVDFIKRPKAEVGLERETLLSIMDHYDNDDYNNLFFSAEDVQLWLKDSFDGNYQVNKLWRHILSKPSDVLREQVESLDMIGAALGSLENKGFIVPLEGRDKRAWQLKTWKD